MLYKIYTIGNYFIIESVSNLFPPIYSHAKNVVIYQKKRDVFAFSGLALNANIHLVDLSNVGISEIVDVDNNAFIDSQAFINWYTANTGNFNRGVPAPTLKSVTSVNSILPDVNGNAVVTIPTLTSDLTNDSGFITIDEVPAPTTKFSEIIIEAETDGIEIPITGGTYMVYNFRGQTVYRYMTTATNANGYPIEDSLYDNLTAGVLSNKITQRNQ